MRKPAVWLGGVVLCVASLAVVDCGSSPATPSSPTPTANTPPISSEPPPPVNNAPEIPIGTGTAIVNLVGDIGWCGSPGVARTSRLLQTLTGTIILAGDIAYMHGSAEDFKNCFDPEYGRFRSRWRAVPGNHEYESARAGPYFDYFGDAAGPARSGYYSFRAASWLVLMLNSNEAASRDSAQYLWVRDELRANPTRCTMAVWHHPFVSSGPNGPHLYMRDLWQLLSESGADVVVSGHDHLYERFALQNAAFEPDDRGLRQFVVGTGGATLYQAAGRRFPNSERVIENFGVLKLTLSPTTYEWDFIDATSSTSADHGTAICH